MSRNIYQMYQDNGDSAGFFVRRDSWSTVVAKVLSIDGMETGTLAGKPPYHGNPPVLMAVYNNDGTIQKESEVMSCPGTDAYTQVDPPPALE